MSEHDGLTPEEEQRLLDAEDGGPEPPEEPVAAQDGEPTNGNVREFPTGLSAEERAESEEEEPDGQFTFVVEERGKQIAFRDLIKRGTPVEYRYVLSGKSIPNVSGGLVDPYAASHLILADCVLDSVKDQYIRDENGKVEKVILYVTLKPRVVQQALSEAGQVMLAEAVKAAA